MFRKAIYATMLLAASGGPALAASEGFPARKCSTTVMAVEDWNELYGGGIRAFIARHGVKPTTVRLAPRPDRSFPALRTLGLPPAAVTYGPDGATGPARGIARAADPVSRATAELPSHRIMMEWRFDGDTVLIRECLRFRDFPNHGGRP